MRIGASAALWVGLSLLAHGQGTQADYDRSAKFAQRFGSLLYRSNFAPKWVNGGRWLWYTVDVAPDKRETLLVDTQSGKRELAFDSAKLAAAIGASPADLHPTIISVNGNAVLVSAKGKLWSVDRATSTAKETSGAAGAGETGSLSAFLPSHPSGSGGETYLSIENRSKVSVDVYWIDSGGQRVKYGSLKPGESRVQHTFGGHVWLLADSSGKALSAYEAVDGSCSIVFGGDVPKRPPAPRPANLSPDGHWFAQVKDNNVWLNADRGSTQLSTDGKPTDAYEGVFAWSPDGRYLATLRTEPEQEHKVYIVRSSPKDQLQPKLITLQYLKPGDRIAHQRVVVFDTTTKKEVTVDQALTPTPWSIEELHWAPDSKELYFVYNQRGHQVLRLLGADATTGKVRTIVEDTSPTFIDYAGKFFLRWLDKTNEAIWMSETTTGYNHLYLIGLKGQVTKKPITSGPWMVHNVESVDEASRQLVLHVMGTDPTQDPYYYHFLRVGFDGSHMTKLTDGDGTHRLNWSPTGDTYVDTYSRVDMAPVAELRRTSDGAKLATLENGDDSQLLAAGWQKPEHFVAKGRDGKTNIYGVIWRPTNFDPTKKYPVIEDIYAGPQDFFTPKAFSPISSQATLAEHGFVVVKLDGMGTSWRGKAFHDVCAKNLADAGFPDRILWMQAAAKDRPWMDLDHVGIFGTSAGGQNAASAVLRFGDFYKAAVADCGCQDNRMDKIWWNELWMGWPVGPEYAANSNVTAAKNLKGKLFLMVGEVDDNVDPASTMQVCNALIQAGKDFDFLVAPNNGHGVLGMPYARRRMVDFFVRNLMGVEPRR